MIHAGYRRIPIEGLVALAFLAGCASTSPPAVTIPPPHESPVEPIVAEPPVPELLARATRVQLVEADHARCALHPTGRLSCWGELGRLSEHDLDPQPRAIELGPDLVGIALSAVELCGLSVDGRVHCRSRVDYDDPAPRASALRSGAAPPVTVELPSPARALVAGAGFTCALLLDGRVSCVGFLGNPSGETCGDHGEAVPCTPEIRVIEGLDEVVSLAAGEFHACAALEDGTVRCWGSNAMLALGARDLANGLVHPVAGIEDALEVAAGDGFSCARSRDGETRCWGAQPYPDDADADAVVHALVRTPVDALDGATGLRAHGDSLCGAFGDSMRCVRPPAPPRATPLVVRGRRVPRILHVGGWAPLAFVGDEPAAVDVVAERETTCIAYADRTVRCRGTNEHGALGDPWTLRSASPIVILDGRGDPTRGAFVDEALDPPSDATTVQVTEFRFDPYALDELAADSRPPDPRMPASLFRATFSAKSRAIRACLRDEGPDDTLEVILQLPPDSNRATSVVVTSAARALDERQCVETLLRETSWPRMPELTRLWMPIVVRRTPEVRR